MPHIIRFSIFKQEDIDLSLGICRRLGITPEDFARSAFFENIEEAARLIKDREDRMRDQKEAEAAMSAEAKEQAEKDLNIQTPGELTNDIASNRDPAGDSATAPVSGNATPSVVAESEVSSTDA